MRFTPPNDSAWRPARDPATLKAVEEFTGHKHTFSASVVLWSLLVAGTLFVGCCCFTGCTTTTVTAPDGTVTTTRGPAPGSLELAGKALQVVADK